MFITRTLDELSTRYTSLGERWKASCHTVAKRKWQRERDFVFLQHKLNIEHADGKHETRINTLCDYGDPKAFSAMARLVDIMRSGRCAGVRG